MIFIDHWNLIYIWAQSEQTCTKKIYLCTHSVTCHFSFSFLNSLTNIYSLLSSHHLDLGLDKKELTKRHLKTCKKAYKNMWGHKPTYYSHHLQNRKIKTSPSKMAFSCKCRDVRRAHPTQAQCLWRKINIINELPHGSWMFIWANILNWPKYHGLTFVSPLFEPNSIWARLIDSLFFSKSIL